MILNHSINTEIVEKMEIVIHNYDCNIDVLVNFFILGELKGISEAESKVPF